MSQVRYVVEKDRAGAITYCVRRLDWTENLAAATLFQTPQAAQTEIDLLPDGYEIGTKIRIIHLTLGDLYQ